MTPERWEQVKRLLQDQFEIADEYDEQLDPGSARCLECVSPLGTLKICFVTQPKLLDKKTNYSHRAGGETSVSYEYDPNEQTSHLEISRWDEASGSWQEMSPDTLPLT